MNRAENSAHRPTVLCVDDERYVLKALERILRRDGWRVLLAGSGEEALECLGRERVDVLVCDQAMPGLCGTDVLRRAKELSPKTVRILLTAHWRKGDVVLPAVNEGEVFRVFPKPWQDEEIRDAVAEALGADPVTWAELRQRVQDRLRGPARAASQEVDASPPES
jgi:response regulator RpfG family c-di-GMP phosphodiesterase